MSLDIVRSVNAQYPALLQQNINASCYQFVTHVIAALKAAGHRAYYVCKSPGEGQYVPPGFVPFTAIGLDGKHYPCSGVSHDALWCDGKQYDTIGQGNDSPDPIFHADGTPMRGIPSWNAIPQQYWRPNNPPLMGAGPSPQPVPVPPPQPPAALFPYPDEGTAVLAFQYRVRNAYNAVGRLFPDGNDADAYRHFVRYGYSCRGMAEPDAANKHIKELRSQLGAPPE